jgi:uncharacterized membrane protein YukC
MVGQKVNARAKHDGFHDILNLSSFSISIFSNEITQSMQCSIQQQQQQQEQQQQQQSILVPSKLG